MLRDTIKHIQSGDLDAYEAVVRQYQGILLGYAAHRLPDIDAAQDVVQLTFIRAYEQLDEYQPERDFGAWRTEYGKKLPVDASGKLPSGEAFDDIRQLRTLLIERHEPFTRSLTEKLMTYAIGRELEIGDRPAIDEILAELAQKNGGLQDLIRLVALSEPFGSN